MAEIDLTLQEQLLLLCLDEDSGRPHYRYLRQALAGAALAELLRRRRVQLDEDRIRVRRIDPEKRSGGFRLSIRVTVLFKL